MLLLTALLWGWSSHWPGNASSRAATRADAVPRVATNRGAPRASAALPPRPPRPETPSPHAYAQAWNGAMPPALAAFREWTQRYLTTSARNRPTLEAEGAMLARTRRADVLALIKHEPERAFALTVPLAVRQTLPASVLAELETRVAGTGDFEVTASTSMRGDACGPIEHTVSLAGRKYHAHVYGRRAWQLTKLGASLHGLALDDELALHESPLHVLEAGEAVAGAGGSRDEKTENVVLAEALGRVWPLRDAEDANGFEARLIAAEDRPGPHVSMSARAPQEETTSAVTAAAASSWTTGIKKVLVLRVDFSDLPGDPVSGGPPHTPYTAAYVQDIMDREVAPFYARSSYGRTSLQTTAAPNVYRLPQTASYYAVNNAGNQILIDAQTVAAADYAVASYDRIITVHSDLTVLPGSKLGYAGIGAIGGPTIDINATFDLRVVAHELGHTYGLVHSGLWQVTDGNPISPNGSLVDTGDQFDVMGGLDTRFDFNPWYKYYLGWIDVSQVQTITTSGVYRVNRFDTPSASGVLALKIQKDSLRSYWIGIRRNFTTNTSLQHGAYIIWARNPSDRQSQLLDMTTPGNSYLDAALAIGCTFTDQDANLTITPVAEGGTAPNEWLDVQIALTTSSSAPRITSQPQSQVASLGATASFSVAASGAEPTYQWMKDGTPLAGRTGSQLSLSSVQAADSGRYAVVVSNSAGTVTSSAAWLMIKSGTTRTWNLAQDWSDTANPNGAWSFTKSLTLLTATTRVSDSWSVPQASWGDLPGVFKSNGTERFTHDWVAGDIAFHTMTEPLSLRWTSPITGVITISGALWHARNIGRYNDWWLYFKGLELAHGTIGDSDPYPVSSPFNFAAGASNPAALQNLVVTPGDMVELRLIRNPTGVFGDYGGVTFTITAETPVTSAPVITSPAAASFISGRPGTFVLTATGVPAPSFSVVAGTLPPWATLFPSAGVIAGTPPDANGSPFVFTVQAGNGVAPPATQDFRLEVKVAPSIATNPANQIVRVGDTAMFTVVATGSAPLSYQWRKSGVAIPNATADTLTLGSVQPASAGKYDVVVTNGATSVTSREATLFVVGGTARVLSAAAGYFHTLLVKTDGTLWSMGLNSDGQLGDGTTSGHLIPVPVATGVASVAAGDNHTLFVKIDGTLWAAGKNTSGQLGNGTTISRSTPVQIATAVASVAAGDNHTMFVKMDGSLWAVGLNNNGQLGDGTTTTRSVPVQIASGVAAVAAGDIHTLFLKTDGMLWAMGNNGYGQLGDGTTTTQLAPVPVAGDVVAMAAGGINSFFVKADGSLWAMGDNSHGQLGDGTTTGRRAPVQVAYDVASVAEGSSFTMFIGKDQTLWAAGWNLYGQLGDTTTTDRGNPVQVASSAAFAATGAFHAVFVKVDGTLWGTGRNDFGQLGDGSATHRSTPVPVIVPNAPTITTQPQSQVVTAGANVTFTVVASGTPAPTYQWKKGGATISGATNATLTLSNVQVAAAGSYVVVVSNVADMVTSDAAILTVNVPPGITTQPASVAVNAGASASFTVAASGTPTPTSFEWQRQPAGTTGFTPLANGGAYSGATTATLTVAAATVAMNGDQFRCVVDNGAAPNATSSAATLSVSEPPLITSAHTTTFAIGRAGSFIFTASGFPAPTFSVTSGALPAWATFNSMTGVISGTPPDATGAPFVFSVSASNGHPPDATQNFTLDVQPPQPPVITTQPAGQTVNAGSTVTFSIVAAGTAPLNYQWRKNGTAQSGATGASLRLTNVQPADSGRYDVVVSNGVNPDAVSTVAALNVVPTGLAASHSQLSYSSSADGASASILNRFTYAGAVTNLRWSVLLPAGWSLAGSTASGADASPATGATGLIEWQWSALPPTPLTFTYSLRIPATDSTPRTLSALAGFNYEGTAIELTAKADPLVVGPTHSADTDHDFRLGLLELTRVIELFNTRNGTVRTGAYKVEDGTEDGFAPDPTRSASASVLLARYHAADTPTGSGGPAPDGRISLLELTRVIELYNYRNGAVRVGQYHLQAGTEDGFAAGP